MNMGKIKTFCKKHKTEILVIGGGTALTIIGIVVGTKLTSKNKVDISGKKCITWTNPNNSFSGLEKVKEFLDLYADKESKFAIFREGINLDAYEIISLDGDKLIWE